jgi:hypothetical protein
MFMGTAMSRISEQLDPSFGGSTYQPEFDYSRLTGQLLRVYHRMKDGRWYSLADIAEYAGGSEAACSARLRDLRKPKYGSHEIDRRRIGKSGLFQYRCIIWRPYAP